MAIAATDIHIRASAPGAAAGNTTAPPGPGGSTGNFIANADITDNVLNNLFPDVTGQENFNLQQDYQCLFVYNAHATLTWQNVVIWLLSEVAGGDVDALGVDPTAVSALGSGSQQAVSSGGKNNAPAGVAFSSPTTQATGLSLGNIAPGQVKAFWVRRTATNSTALANDGVTLGIAGDTAP